MLEMNKMSGGNIIIHAVLHANAEQSHLLADLLLRTQRACQSEPGCITYRMTRDLVSGDIFHVFEIWDSETTFFAHKVGQPFRYFLAGLSVCGQLVESTRWIGSLGRHVPGPAGQVSA